MNVAGGTISADDISPFPEPSKRAPGCASVDTTSYGGRVLPDDLSEMTRFG